MLQKFLSSAVRGVSIKWYRITWKMIITRIRILLCLYATHHIKPYWIDFIGRIMGYFYFYVLFILVTQSIMDKTMPMTMKKIHLLLKLYRKTHLIMQYMPLTHNTMMRKHIEMQIWRCGQKGNLCELTHWDRMMHICNSKLTIIGSDNGLLPGQCQAIIWTNARKL